MLGSPDSSEPVRHVSNVSKLRVLACSGITGPLCAAVAAVLAKLSSSHCSCQAALQLGHRHISADPEPGSESESCNSQDDLSPQHHLDLSHTHRDDRGAGPRGPGSRLLGGAEHSRRGSFPLSARVWLLGLPSGGPAELAGE